MNRDPVHTDLKCSLRERTRETEHIEAVGGFKKKSQSLCIAYKEHVASRCSQAGGDAAQTEPGAPRPSSQPPLSWPSPEFAFL